MSASPGSSRGASPHAGQGTAGSSEAPEPIFIKDPRTTSAHNTQSKDSDTINGNEREGRDEKEGAGPTRSSPSLDGHHEQDGRAGQLPPLQAKSSTSMNSTDRAGQGNSDDIPPLAISKSKSQYHDSPQDSHDDVDLNRPHSTGTLNGGNIDLHAKKQKKKAAPKHITFQDDVSTIDVEDEEGRRDGDKDGDGEGKSSRVSSTKKLRPPSAKIGDVNRNVRLLIPVKTVETEYNLLNMTERSELTERTDAYATTVPSGSEYSGDESMSYSTLPRRTPVSARSGAAGTFAGAGLLQPVQNLSGSVMKRREQRMRAADHLRLVLPKTTHLLDMKPARGLNLRTGGSIHPLAEHKKAGLMPKIKDSRKQLSWWARSRLRWREWWRIRRARKRDPIPLFRDSLKSIEGNFGASVASVFLFHRFVFIIDLLVALLWVSLIIAPGIFNDASGGFSDAVFPDALAGTGLERTWMFYAGYPRDVGSYPMDLMYLFVVIVMGLSNFLLVTKTVYTNYTKTVKRAALISSERTLDFSSVVYSSWDHAVYTEAGAAAMAKGNCIRILDVINFTRHRLSISRKRTTGEKYELFLRRMIGITATLGIFVAVFFLVSFMVSNQSELETISPFLIPVIISGMKVTFPLMVKGLIILENWDNPKTALRNEIARIYGLKMFNIIMLVLRTYDVESVLDPLNQSQSTATASTCRESRLGVEFWRLLWADLIVSALASAMYGFVGRAVMKRRLEFDYAEKVIDLIYRQALVWLGVLLSPVLAFVGIISQYLLFHWEKLILMKTCLHPEKPWNLRRTSNFFLIILGVTLLWCLILTAIFVRLAVPECGPHAGRVPWDDWLAIINNAPEYFYWVWEFATSPIVLGPTVIILFSMLMMQTTMLKEMTRLFEQSVLELEEEHRDALDVAQLGVERAPVL
eukprot:TRINITY_DN3326_c0_g1_i2.p1 TRINITY_DN3326_c0_g1~~TRINITY_DN3326_c0_g1_i2.p1  ORF type:complete len:916 (+),score=165.93 TRINITY_DN3326_c0_g1_i2:301-3048(+)